MAVVPVQAARTLEAYLTGRKQLMGHIEQQDVEQPQVRRSPPVPSHRNERRHHIARMPRSRIAGSGDAHHAAQSLVGGPLRASYGIFASWFISSSGATSKSVTSKPPSAPPGPSCSRFLTMLVFSLFFGKLAHISARTACLIRFFITARCCPGCISPPRCRTATNTIVENQRLITKVYFPRLALPLSSVLSGLVDFAISFLMFVVLMIYYHIRPTPALLWFPAFLLLAVLTALGVGLWLSALNAIYRDVRYVLPFLVQFWLFASPVVYPSSLVPAEVALALRAESDGRSDRRISLVAHRAAATRRGACSSFLPPWSWSCCLSGLAYFQKMETTMADVV